MNAAEFLLFFLACVVIHVRCNDANIKEKGSLINQVKELVKKYDNQDGSNAELKDEMFLKDFIPMAVNRLKSGLQKRELPMSLFSRKRYSSLPMSFLAKRKNDIPMSFLARKELPMSFLQKKRVPFASFNSDYAARKPMFQMKRNGELPMSFLVKKDWGLDDSFGN